MPLSPPFWLCNNDILPVCWRTSAIFCTTVVNTVNKLFERSEFLIATWYGTSQQKICACARTNLGISGVVKNAIVVARYDNSMIPGAYVPHFTYYVHHVRWGTER